MGTRTDPSSCSQEPTGAGALSAGVAGAGSSAADELARLRAVAGRHRLPGAAVDRRLPVLAPLEPLLVDRGVRRGSVTVVRGGPGCTSLSLALAAGPTRAGSWVACVGADEVGWAAAEELGVDLGRLVVVRPPEQAVPEVLAALVDAVDLVVWGSRPTLSHTTARRLHARARERGTALVVVDPRRSARAGWPGAPDVELVVRDLGWSGIGAGWGHLRSRHVRVEAGGRRSPGPPRRVELLLPGPDGPPVALESTAGDTARPRSGAVVAGLPAGRTA